MGRATKLRLTYDLFSSHVAVVLAALAVLLLVPGPLLLLWVDTCDAGDVASSVAPILAVLAGRW